MHLERFSYKFLSRKKAVWDGFCISSLDKGALTSCINKTRSRKTVLKDNTIWNSAFNFSFYLLLPPLPASSTFHLFLKLNRIVHLWASLWFFGGTITCVSVFVKILKYEVLNSFELFVFPQRSEGGKWVQRKMSQFVVPPNART